MAVLNCHFHTYIKQKNCNPSLIKRNRVTALSISLLSPSSPPCSDNAVLPSRASPLSAGYDFSRSSANFDSEETFRVQKKFLKVTRSNLIEKGVVQVFEGTSGIDNKLQLCNLLERSWHAFACLSENALIKTFPLTAL
ncbi:uncharacterized protein DS421_19g666630 [Arachis hypogaea]|uniref:Uncharacterized protein n=1 Tax=Arachis hypogaea TaxID=3818 RepID=A0A6B9VFX8_ARAHY|nr:uncharacterized protein DS421_19g666630 [Arachis hypogaea]